MSALTQRENFIRFLKGEPYEWMPSGRDRKSFLPSLSPENIARGRVAQQEPFDRKLYGGKDWFGVEWKYDPVIKGSMEVAPLMDEIEGWEDKIKFPDLSALDWAGCAEKNKEYLQTDQILVSTLYTGFFERLISFLGFENAAMALVDDDAQDEVKKLFDKLADFYIEQIRYMHQYLNVEFIILHDDWGTQRGPMFSAETHQEMIVPYVKKVVDAAHQEGVFVEMHSCGMIEPLIPGLISTGVDTWCGQEVNNKLALIQKYGGEFKFGIEFRLAQPVSDEELIKLVRQFKANYTGKEVWLIVGWELPPAQAQLVHDEIYKDE